MDIADVGGADIREITKWQHNGNIRQHNAGDLPDCNEIKLQLGDQRGISLLFIALCFSRVVIS